MLDPFIDGLFARIAVLLMLAAVVGGLATFLRQPLIVAYIAVGVLAGPAVLGVTGHQPEIELLADLGVAVLLFLVGLRLDLTLVRRMGAVAAATGLGQVAVTSVVGFFICLGLGIDVVPSIYIAVALTFSSTIIIVKLLTDKREIDSLHGRIAVGFLIVQDLVVVVAMIVLSAIAAGGTGGAGAVGGADVDSAGLRETLLAVGAVIVKGVVLLGAIGVLMRWVLPGVARRLAMSMELLVLFGVAWAVLLSAACEHMGFSREVGAFLAGVSLASTPFRDALGGRLASLRDFLLLFFFLRLGGELDLSGVGAQLGPSLILSLFVLIGNPIIVLVIMGVMGYRARTGFLAGLTVAQISEFSLIFAAMGVAIGHLTDAHMALVTLVGIITIVGSTLMILHSGRLYAIVAPLLRVFERRVPKRELGDESAVSAVCPDIVVIGLGRFGGEIARHLRQRGANLLGLDFDPFAVNAWTHAGHRAEYADAEDPDLAERLPLSQLRWIVSTVPEVALQRTLLQSLRAAGYDGKVAVTVHHAADGIALEREGADLIFLPFADAAQRAADEISAGGSNGGPTAAGF